MYEPLQERLKALKTSHASRLSAQRTLQEEVIDLVSRYDHYVSPFPQTSQTSLTDSVGPEGYFNVTDVRGCAFAGDGDGGAGC